MHSFFSDITHPHPSPDLYQPSDASLRAHMNFVQQNQMMDLESLIQSMQQETNAGGQGGNGGGGGAGGMQLIEQQMRLAQLQQLQQLQNQIFQQQIELLSSGNNSFNGMPIQGDRSRDQQQQQHQYGLPTPVNSTELRATHPSEFVSPMILQQQHLPLPHPSLPLPGSSDSQQAQSMMHNYGGIPAHLVPPTPHSAPASVVFQNPHSHSQSSPYAMPSAETGELDFGDISPLTSPWLGASGPSGSQPFRAPSVSGSMQPSSSQMQGQMQQGQRKRATGTTSSGDESATAPRPPRKRPSPTSPTIGATPRMPKVQAPVPSRRASLRGTRSANSTPLFPPTGGNPGQRGGDVLADTPSPIDIHMPPPAHPPPPPMSASTSGGSTTPTHSAGMIPVTPASIMNIGRMGLGMMGDPGTRSKTKKTGGATEKGKAAAAPAASGVSPSLKPIRPAGAAAMNTAPSAAQPVHMRKTSHKAAEQKRRDSLKTSFDDLRLLLPPIPLPSDDGFPDEPILPGAMPPRGPPKGNAEGPNRGVSKLQLLRCGNEFIRVLKARIERRDSEIELLRKEVGRLRVFAPEEERESAEADLERDVDAIEKEVGGLFGIARRAMSAEACDGEDGDEEGGE